MNRRDMLAMLVGSLSTSITAKDSLSRKSEIIPLKIGLVVYCQGIRIRYEREKNPSQPFDDPMNFLEHCHRFGAGGMQIPLNVRSESYTSKLREKAESYGMFIDAVGDLPHDQSGVEQFEAVVKTAKEAGAEILRCVMMPGRRYEEYNAMEEFNRIRQQAIRSVELAQPIAAKQRIKLAIENHKVQRIPEMLDVLHHISSEYVGICLDTGNSFVLLEDPIDVAEAYAPWTFTVHYKDQALREYEDGFLFADVKYGEGFIDLPRVAQIVRKANPKAHFNLEMITRDPLKVTCLTEKYWSCMADVSGKELARTFRTIRTHTLEQMPEISTLPLEKQVAVEEENVKTSLAYAKEHCEM